MRGGKRRGHDSSLNKLFKNLPCIFPWSECSLPHQAIGLINFFSFLFSPEVTPAHYPLGSSHPDFFTNTSKSSLRAFPLWLSGKESDEHP